jgi:hypothetical protein
VKLFSVNLGPSLGTCHWSSDLWRLEIEVTVLALSGRWGQHTIALPLALLAGQGSFLELEQRGQAEALSVRIWVVALIEKTFVQVDVNVRDVLVEASLSGECTVI